MSSSGSIGNDSNNNKNNEQQRKICLLPQQVIDRIAAGEVVQRPVSVVKELLENSLDAGATRIVISFTAPLSLKQQHGICGKISVADNGCGIQATDLPLAATRHATSKLRTVEDFAHLSSFGFRGEALASVSMVSKLQIIARTSSAASGHTMTYIDGKPIQATPVPRARQVGTTITVQDLFYNLPQRRPSRDDFQQILGVAQKYAVQYASRGVGVVCEKQAATESAAKRQSSSITATTDLNTAMGLVMTIKASTLHDENDINFKDLQIRATKQVIAMIYGSALESHLQYFECRGESSDEAATTSAGKSQQEEEHQIDAPYLYKCRGAIVLPSYSLTTTKKERPQFILFINQRLVDSRPIQRAMEDVYAQFSASKPPLLFLSIEVPPTTVDVNVHPNKRECALLNLDAIIQSLAARLHRVMQDAGQSFVMEHPTTKKQPVAVNNPYNSNNKRRKSDPNENENMSQQQQSLTIGMSQQPLSLSQKSVPSSKKVRTSRATQSGALEPFLVRKEPLSRTSASTRNTQLSQDSSLAAASPTQQDLSQDSAASESSLSSATVVHRPGCPLLVATTVDTAGNDVDLTQPGAFATISSQCTCNTIGEATAGAANVIRVPRQALSRPKRVRPNECKYDSIRSLRKSVQTQTDQDVLAKLRKAYFVGVVSVHRSLVQVGEELVLLNHDEAAQELFYQLALNHFPGGATVANLGPIDIHTVVAHCLQMEESLQSSKSRPISCQLKISDTSSVQAEQAAACLLQQAPMLKEYFSIIIEKDQQERIMLRGLPVLLESYCPSPHALPLFLLRLATEVCWTDEKPCFHDVCKELGRFYASIPTDDHLASHVRHTLFPALTSILQPRQSLVAKQDFVPVTKLSKLYRIFERC